MAVPAYATDLTDIFTDGGSWTLVGGGRTTDPDTDDYIQGNSCWSHDPFSSGIEGGVVNSAQTITAGDAVFIWLKADISPALATHAAGGIQALIGNAATALKAFYVKGSDDYIYGGWLCIPVDPTKTPSTNIGTPTAVTDYFGVRWNVPATGPSKGYPFKIDAIRHGKAIEITAGDAGTPATWDAAAVYDSNTTRQWGLVQPTNTGAAIQGNVFWGTAATAVYSVDSNRTIVVNDTEWTDTDFTKLIFPNVNNVVVWDNVGVSALGTNNRCIIDVTADGFVQWVNSVFQGIDVTNLLLGCVFEGSKWIGCNEVTAGGASLLGSKILVPTVAADSYGLLWNTTGNPDTATDGMEFSMGAAAHHAIEFDATNTPLAFTLRNMHFVGFSGTNGLNNSTFNFPSTTKDYTVTLIGCTTDTAISYKVGAGGSVTFIIDPVQIDVHVQDEAGADVAGAFVYIDTNPSIGDTADITNTTTNINGDITQAAYNGVATSATIRVRKYGYKANKGTISLLSNTANTVILIADPQQV